MFQSPSTDFGRITLDNEMAKTITAIKQAINRANSMISHQITIITDSHSSHHLLDNHCNQNVIATEIREHNTFSNLDILCW